MIDVLTFEARRSMSNYVATLAQNIDTIVVCKLHHVFALQCFHFKNDFQFFFYRASSEKNCLKKEYNDDDDDDDDDDDYDEQIIRK